jgi:hypothetical protein
MPIFLKSKNRLCQERAENDSIFYYDEFKKMLNDYYLENKTAEAHQQIIRLNKWIDKYQEFAYNYHLNNFIQADDIFVDQEYAKKFSYGIKIPRAPCIEVFEEIK